MTFSTCHVRTPAAAQGGSALLIYRTSAVLCLAAGPTLPSFTLLLLLAAHSLHRKRQIAVFLNTAEGGSRCHLECKLGIWRSSTDRHRGKGGGWIYCFPQACFTFHRLLSDHSQLNFALHFRPPPLSHRRVPGTSRFSGGERCSGGKSHARNRQRRRRRPSGSPSAGEAVGTRPLALLLPRRTGAPDASARRL